MGYYDRAEGEHAAPVTITITREKIARPRGYGGPGAAWYWHYYATGPDTITIGARVLPRRFDNRHIGALRSALRRAYGRTVTLIEEWNR